MSDTDETKEPAAIFNFSAYPPDTFFHERRSGRDRRKASDVEADAEPPLPAPNRRERPERRRRVDPTTFEKQYSPDELEFMNAMQQFKHASGKSFPTYSDVLGVAFGLGYRKVGHTPPAVSKPKSS